MSSGVISLLQQQSPHRVRESGLMLASTWQYWNAATIASITQAPVDAVENDWPLIYAALHVRGIADLHTCMATIGTIAIETAHTFKPVREAFWLDEEWRRNNLRYWPYYGRGYVQLTWQTNYEYYGKILGVNLVGMPDWAMQPNVAAHVLAQYFLDHDIASAARRGDWREVRRLVQGADAGLSELVAVVNALALALS